MFWNPPRASLRPLCGSPCTRSRQLHTSQIWNLTRFHSGRGRPNTWDPAQNLNWSLEMFFLQKTSVPAQKRQTMPICLHICLGLTRRCVGLNQAPLWPQQLFVERSFVAGTKCQRGSSFKRSQDICGYATSPMWYLSFKTSCLWHTFITIQSQWIIWSRDITGVQWQQFRKLNFVHLIYGQRCTKRTWRTLKG